MLLLISGKTYKCIYICYFMVSALTHIADLEEILSLKQSDSEVIKEAEEKAFFDSRLANPLLASGVLVNGEYILYPISDTFTEEFGENIKGVNYKNFISYLTGDKNLIEECESSGSFINNLEVKIRNSKTQTIKHFLLSSKFSIRKEGFQMTLNPNFEGEMAELYRNISHKLNDSGEYFAENVKLVEELCKSISIFEPYIEDFGIYEKSENGYSRSSIKAKLTLDQLCEYSTEDCGCMQLINAIHETSQIGLCEGRLICATPIIYENENSEIGQNLGLLRLVFNKKYISDGNDNNVIKKLTKRIATYLSPIINNRNEAIKDHLTGLYGAVQLTPELNRYKSLLERKEAIPFSLVLMDLDKFKSVNDTYGHDGGDYVLKTVGHMINESIRPSDIAIRNGGDEFILIFNGSPNETKIPINRIHGLINNDCIDYNGSNIDVGCSMGVVDLTEKHLDDRHKLVCNNAEILKFADNALYESKHNGRGQITYHQFD